MHHVIIGMGPAGVIAAETLRQHDRQAQITLIGAETEQPYSRMAIPYLLMGNIDEQGTYLRKQARHFERLNIDLLYGRVTQLECPEKRLHLDTGQTLTYDKCLIASGSHPVKPPVKGFDLPDVLHCWTLQDARQIAAKVKPGAKVVLMGAGFIGCIILEALVRRGAQLTVVERGDRMVPRMMNEKAGNLIKQWCIDKGIEVLTSTQVRAVERTAGGISIELTDHPALSADLVVAATGVQPNTEFLKGSGIEIDQGILINRQMQTSVEDIYAAGDVAQGLDFSTGQYTVQAIQPTAAEHAQMAAKNMVGLPGALHQGAINMNVLDTLGLISSSFGQWMGVRHGDASEIHDADNFKYLNLQFEEDILIGATSIGLTQHIGVLRGLIQNRTRLGVWKQRLKNNPTRIMEAWLASQQVLK